MIFSYFSHDLLTLFSRSQNLGDPHDLHLAPHPALLSACSQLSELTPLELTLLNLGDYAVVCSL